MHAISNKEDLQAALLRVQALWQAASDSRDAQERDALADIIEAYEEQHHALGPGDPIEIIRFKLRELAWSQRELARRLGWSGGRVSELLARKRRLTLAMIQQLAPVLGIAAGLLVPELAPDTLGSPSQAGVSDSFLPCPGKDTPPGALQVIRQASAG